MPICLAPHGFSPLSPTANLVNNTDVQLSLLLPSALTFLQYYVQGSQVTDQPFYHTAPGTTVVTETKNPTQI